MRVWLLGSGASKAETPRMPLMGEFFAGDAVREQFFLDREAWGSAVDRAQALGFSRPELKSGEKNIENLLRALGLDPLSRHAAELLRSFMLLVLRHASSSAIRAGCPMHSQLVRSLSPNDVVLSLNYDLLMDFALSEHATWWQAQTGYGFSFDGEVGPDGRMTKSTAGAVTAPRYLKLHGSLSWLRREWTTVVRPGPEISELRPGTGLFLRIPSVPVACLPGYDRDEELVHFGANESFVPRPHIIAPAAGGKAIDEHPFPLLWSAAERALRQCDELLVWGCSFREDDAQLGEMVWRSLHRPTSTRVPIRVVDASPCVAERLRSRFSAVARIEYAGSSITSVLS